MGNCMIGFPNRMKTASVSGPAWVSTLPLSNLLDRRLGIVARSVDLTLANTQYDVNLGAGKNTRLLADINHNFSLAATYRKIGSNVADFSTTVYDSGWQDVWPVVYPVGTVAWEDDNWWSGKYTSEQITGITPALVHILPRNIVAQYWRTQISDPTNAAGYIQIGRPFVGPGWQPTRNMSYGASIAWEVDTEIQKAHGGSETFDAGVPYRVVRVPLDWLTVDEGLANSFEIDKLAGVSEELLYIHDPADTVHALRRRFLARIRQLNPMEYPYVNTAKKLVELKELL